MTIFVNLFFGLARFFSRILYVSDSKVGWDDIQGEEFKLVGRDDISGEECVLHIAGRDDISGEECAL